MPLTKPIVFPITENMYYENLDLVIMNLTYETIPNWSVNVKANESYIFNLSLYLYDPTTAKFQAVFPTCDMSGQMNYIFTTNQASLKNCIHINNATLNYDFSTGASAIQAVIQLQFTFKADGIIAFQSMSSDGLGNTILYAGSYFSYRKVNLI